MNVDTQEFAALKAQVRENTERLAVLSAGLMAAYHAAGWRCEEPDCQGCGGQARPAPRDRRGLRLVQS